VVGGDESMVLSVVEAVFVFTKSWAMLVAVLAVLLLLSVTHVLVVSAQPDPKDNVEERRRGVKALVMGADGRASTSKVQAVLWTFSVFFAFVFLLVWGRNLGCGGVEGLSPEEAATCAEAAEHRTVFASVGKEIQTDYYVLLGFPLGVAVAARALTTSKVASGTITKADNEDPKAKGVVQGLRETISNDNGETDLLDFQYFAFNLIALAFFWIEFVASPSRGLPDLPATLVGLSGLSAAAYTTRKAVQTDMKPGVSAVIPRRIPLEGEGITLSIIGTGLGDRKLLGPGDDPGSPPAWVSPHARVMLDGVSLRITSWRSTRIEAVLVPAEYVAVHPEVGTTPTPAEVVVDVSDGPPSDAFTVEVYRVGEPK
jgi:hypothetical protein